MSAGVGLAWTAESRRRAIGVALLALLGAVAWRTMEAGPARWLVVILLAGFALRIVLTTASR